jgi:Tol biopolymer transport system component
MVAMVSDQSGDGDIRIYNSSTGTVTQATSAAGPEVYPAFTPDNQAIVYNRKVKMQLDIYRTDLKTQETTRVVGGSGDQSRPVVTKSGQIVYFSATDSEGPWNIGVTEADGSNKRVLASGIRLPYSSRPSISPDGKWVAFTYDNPVKANSVYMAAVDGSTVKEIKTDFRACGEPAIGMQGGQLLLAFTALPAGEADWRMLQVMNISQFF